MNKEQIIDEVYERYSKEYEKDSSIGFRLRHKDKNGNPTYGKGNKEMFINKCKTDSEFSEKWGLKIEERELDMMERWAIADLTPNMEEFVFANYMCDKHNVPTKLITITYKDTIIESYE